MFIRFFRNVIQQWESIKVTEADSLKNSYLPYFFQEVIQKE